MPSSNAVNTAFSDRPDIQKRIVQTIAKHPILTGLFEDIAQHITTITPNGTQNPVPCQDDAPSKKRKLEHRPVESAGWDQGNTHTVTDISFSIPQRKKYNLHISPVTGIWASTSTSSEASVEFGVKWARVQDVFCLPVPEKAQSQYNFCILSNTEDGSTSDQLLWTVPCTIPKSGTITGGIAVPRDDTYKSFLVSELNKSLRPFKKRVLEPTKEEFASQIVQAHRKGETAFHVKAFRGSKEGYLFPLATGIIWGFKKPLEFYPFDIVESISYTSILQRTFNMNIAIRTTSEADVQELEFSMIDQADFARIDEYVKRHGLQDASMAEGRRAKKLNVNGVKGAEAPDVEGQPEEGELEKAQRQAEDLEDEEEDDENFDPGSEGESEGSGSDSEEGDEDQDAGPDEAMDGEDGSAED